MIEQPASATQGLNGMMKNFVAIFFVLIFTLNAVAEDVFDRALRATVAKGSVGRWS